MKTCEAHAPMSADVKEIKSDVKQILSNQAQDRLDNYKACSHHREELQADMQRERERVNKIYTIFGVVMFAFGVAIKQGWI